MWGTEVCEDTVRCGPPASYNLYATGVKHVVEIESEWTARFRETHSSR
jgi:hypothetical protein